MTNDVQIAVMARAPEPGRAKTRLIPRLGADGAAALHARLVEHALRAAVATRLPVTLWCAPDLSHPFFAKCVKEFGVALRPQPDGDLGARMTHVFEMAGGPTLLMGSDCPAIDAALLLRCAELLRAGGRAVLLPAEDGGYGLVGLAALRCGRFSATWSGEPIASWPKRAAVLRALGHRRR